MNEIYLKFYEEETRRLPEELLGDIFDMKYLRYTNDGYYELKRNVYIGKIDKKNHFSFLLQKGDDLFLNPDVSSELMDEDVVLVEVIKKKPKVQILLKRNLKYIVATARARKRGFKYFTDKPYNKNILVDDESQVVNGSILKLEIITIKNERMYTKVAEVIGHESDPNIDILKIVASFDWPNTDFNLLEEEASKLNIDIENEKTHRLDLTNELIVTIDGADAKDLDDAISLTYNDGLYHLGIHIADVSLYVKRGGLIDKSAYKKSTSAYLANSVIPMLPRKLSNDLCSLNPHTDKLTLSVLMEINEFGKVVDYKIEKTIINSKYRLTYDEVNNLINNNISLNNKELDEMILKMNELSQILKKLRNKRGSLNFKSEELKFIFDENQNLVDVSVRENDEGEQLIESFMLLANETVAFHMETNSFPSLYRVHENPDESKLEQAFNVLTNLGLKINKNMSTKTIQKILKEVENSSLEHIVNMFLLRAMQKAKYDHNSIGHYGLGARYYTHFTSPIRRYPDLILHRIIKELVFAENNNLKNYKFYENNLEEIAEHTSKMERKAIDMEREVESFFQAKYMEDKIGEKFDGQIVQVLKSGFFVKLTNGIEGFVNVKLQYSNYDFNEITLSHKINGQLYKIGDKIVVELYNVNILEREIDFIIKGVIN